MTLRKRALLPMVIVVLALSACSSELDKVRGQFIDNCMSSGAPKSNCRCAIDKLQDAYTGGDLLLQLKRNDDARVAYEKAKAALPEDAAVGALQMKLDDLAKGDA